MYTNPTNIIKTVINLLDLNSYSLQKTIHVYSPKSTLRVFEGMRNVLGVDSYPSLEIEPTTASNQWATTRSQRPTYQFDMTFTTVTQNEKFHLEYHTTVGTRLVEILTSPQNLQMCIVNETKWNPNSGLVQTRILDSLVSDVSWSSNKEGTIRISTFSYFATVNETYPEILWNIGESNTPSILKPEVIP